MVEFEGGNQGIPRGPCVRILNREEEFIREMVDKTQRSEKEYIANIVEIEGKMGHTEMVEGDELSIVAEKSANVMMDAIDIADEMKDKPGHVNVDEIKRHVVHTHPNGFTGLSFNDIRAFIDDIVSGGAIPHSELVATMTDKGIWLGGAYMAKDLSEENMKDLQADLSLANSDASLDEYTAEMRLIESLERNGFEFCTVLFPER